MDTLRIDAVTPALVREHVDPRVPRRTEARSEVASGPESAHDTSEADVSVVVNEPAGSSAEKTSDEEDRALLQDFARELQEEMLALGKHSLQVTYEEEAERYVVSVVDSETREVIRQIPPEALLEARRRLDELRGLLFDERS